MSSAAAWLCMLVLFLVPARLWGEDRPEAPAARAKSAAEPGPADDTRALPVRTDLAEREETWQVMYIGPQRIGYTQLVTGELQRNGRKIIVSESISQMTVKRFGVELKMLMVQSSEEDDSGRLLSFRASQINPPVSEVQSRGTVDGDQLVIESESAGQRTTSRITLPPDVKAPSWIDRVLVEDPLQPGEQREFRMFDPQLAQVATVSVEHAGTADVELLDGSTRTAARHLLRHSALPGVTMTSYTDDRGESLRTDMGLLDIRTYAATREEALREVSGADLDLGFRSVIRTEPIPGVHDAQRGVYQVQVNGSAASAFASGETQSLEPVSDRVVELTVTSIRPGAPRSPNPPTPDASPGPEYLEASLFIPTADPQVRALAERGAAGESDPAKLAVALERFVHSVITNKNFSTSCATAAEVARDLSGDCTEHAVLLAALLRVHRIPSRVAVGFVYAESIQGFGGHMWTEAWLDGRWTPLDGTLGRGGIGVGHLKVVDSALSENSPTPVSSFVKLIPLLNELEIKVEQVE